MMDLDRQKRLCGVAFEPIVDRDQPVMLAVDYERPYQLLTLAEVAQLDRNLHEAFRIAHIAARARRRRPAGLGVTA